MVQVVDINLRAAEETVHILTIMQALFKPSSFVALMDKQPLHGACSLMRS